MFCTMLRSNILVLPVALTAKIWSRTLSVMAHLLAFGKAVHSGDKVQTAAVIPRNHNVSGIIHTNHRAFSSYRRCLHIFHRMENHTAARRELLTETLHSLSVGKSLIHTSPPPEEAALHFVSQCWSPAPFLKSWVRNRNGNTHPGKPGSNAGMGFPAFVPRA